MTLEEMEKLLTASNDQLLNGLSAVQKENNEQLKSLADMLVNPPAPEPEPVTLTAESIAAAVAAALHEAQDDDEEEEPEPEPEPAAEPEPVSEDVENRAGISAMADIAVTQSSWDPDIVRSLQIASVVGKETPEQFYAKLKSLQIVATPTAPLDFNERPYNLGVALSEMAHGYVRESKYEHALSQNILSKTNLGIMPPGTLAIPMDAIKQLNTNTGAASGGDAIDENIVMMVRSDVPDPLNILPLVTNLPSVPGDSRIVTITVPTPAMVPEPGDTGYVKTGDATADDVTFSPKLLVEKLQISRLQNVQAPAMLAAIMNIGLAKMDEQRNSQIVYNAAGTNDITSLYNYTGVLTSTALAAVANLTAAVVNTGVQASFAIDDGTKRILVSPEAETAFKGLAQPASVGRFYENGTVDGIPVLPTQYFGSTKPARGIVGPMSQIYVKNWDGAVFVSRRYEDGNDYLLLEVFWDMQLVHPALFYRFAQT